MRTIVELQGPANCGKTETITLAARKCSEKGCRLIAKEFRRQNKEIIEVYEINAKSGRFYIAYISQGDSKEYIERNLGFITAFQDAATKGVKLLDELKKVEGKYKKAAGKIKTIESHKQDYAIIEHNLKSIGKDFHIDAIVIASHPDMGVKDSTCDAINQFAKGNEYNEIVLPQFFIRTVETNGTNDKFNAIEKANEYCALYINEVAFNSL
jgi:hypothetical protein